MLIRSYEDRANISRAGTEVVLEDNRHRIACRGGTPTVRNIDRIAIRGANGVTVDVRSGPLGPGATREDGVSEIEVRAPTVRRGWLRGSNKGTRLFARGGSEEDFAVDMNRPRGSRFEPDLFLGAPDLMFISDGRGDDLIEVSRVLLREPGSGGLALLNGPGDDRLIAGDGAEQVTDGGGDDVIRTGGEDDFVAMKTGTDRVFLGPGGDNLYYADPPAFEGRDTTGDRIYGGAGPDHLDIRSGRPDLLSCGPGRDLVLDRDGFDLVRPDCRR